MEQLEQDGKDEGNRVTSSFSTYKGNNFCITVNNYTLEQLETLSNWLQNNCKKYILSKEIGSKSATPHLQGAFKTRQHKRFKTIFKEIGFNCHLEQMKGNWDQNIKYCSKENNVICCSEQIDEPLEIIENLLPWQENVISIIKNKPDERTIHWIYDEIGNSGKTKLCKYMLTKFERCIFFSGGKQNDICSQILLYKKDPKICLFNFARSNEGKISYNAIEQIKDGLVNSSKYEGGFKCFNCPHVIIFANWYPDTSKLSNDRWNILKIEVDENNELKLCQ